MKLKSMFGRAALTLTLSLPLIGTPALAQDQGGEGATPEASPSPEGGNDGQGRRRRQDGEGGGRGGRGMMGLPLDQLKERLGLSEEQMQTLQALQAEMREAGQQMRELFQSGDMEAARAKMQELRQGMMEKVEGVLNEEQRAKFKEFQEGMRGRFGGGRGERGERGGPGRERMRERLREEAVKALALSEEESAVVLPRLDTLLESRELLDREQAARRNDFMEKVRGTTDPAELQKALEAFRQARELDKGSVHQAQDQLREVLTLEQEAKLVALGILE